MEMSKGVPSSQIYTYAAVIRGTKVSERTFLGVTVAVNMEMSLALTPRISRFDCSVMDACLIRGLRQGYVPQRRTCRRAQMDIGHSRDMPLLVEFDQI